MPESPDTRLLSDPQATAEARLAAITQARQKQQSFPEHLSISEKDVEAMQENPFGLLKHLVEHPGDAPKMIVGARLGNGSLPSPVGSEVRKKEGPLSEQPIIMFGEWVLRQHHYEAAAIILSDARLSGIVLTPHLGTTLGGLAVSSVGSLRPLVGVDAPSEEKGVDGGTRAEARQQPAGVDPAKVASRIATAQVRFRTGVALARKYAELVPEEYQRDPAALLSTPVRPAESPEQVVSGLARPQTAERISVAESGHPAPAGHTRPRLDPCFPKGKRPVSTR